MIQSVPMQELKLRSHIEDWMPKPAASAINIEFVFCFILFCLFICFTFYALAVNEI